MSHFLGLYILLPIKFLCLKLETLMEESFFFHKSTGYKNDRFTIYILFFLYLNFYFI